LQSIYKKSKLKKLQLSKKFPKTILHTRRDTLGIGLIKLKTAINTLATKLYINYQRANALIAKIIQAIN